MGSASRFLALLAFILTVTVLAACTREVVKEVPVEKVVTKEVVKEIPVEKIVEVEKEVVKTVEVDRVVEVEKEVVKEVQVPGETVVVEKEVVREVRLPGETVVVVATPVPAGEEQFFFRTLDAFPKYGGKLKLAAHGPPAHFDMYASVTIANAFAQSTMYERLLRRDLRDASRLPVIPDLAHRWEISADGSIYTFFLREGVKWHDGTDFTSEDVEASYNRIINPPEGLVSHRQATFGVVSNINVEDDYTIAFELSEPRAEAFMMQGFASGWNIIHQKETLDANNGDLKQADDAPGTGPFKYLNRTSESWSLEKNPDYWNPNAPYVNEIEMIWLGAFSTQLSAALLGGLVDFGMFIPPDTYKQVLERSNMSGLTWSIGAPNEALGFNLQKAPFSDVRVRQAVHLAINKQAHVAIANEFNPSQFGSWYADGTPYAKPRALLLQELGYAPDRRDEAIAEAKKLMAQAGYANGYPEPLLYPTRESTTDQLQAALLKEELAEIGLDLNIKIFQVAEIFETIQRGEFDIAGAGCQPTVPDPADYFRKCYSTKQDGTPSDGNVTKWNNDEFNALLVKFEREADSQKRIEMSVQLAEILDRERPFTLIGYGQYHWGWYNHLRGMPVNGGTSGYDVYQWDYAWLDR